MSRASTSRARRAALAVALACSLASTGARAEDPPTATATLPTRRARFAWDKVALRLDVSYRDVVDGALEKKLTSGLPTTIVLRGYVFRETGGEPVALTVKSCRVVYDLWDEVYQITVAQTGGGETTTVAPSFEGLLRRCAETTGLYVASRAELASPETLYLAALVEVNPVSPDMIDRIKRWVSRPSGSTGIAPGDALFGSFVGLFVARIGSADRQLLFRTALFPAAPP